VAKLRVKIESFAKDTVNSTYDGFKLALTDIVVDNANEIYRKDMTTIALRPVKAIVDTCSMSIADLTKLADDIDRSTYYGDYRQAKDDAEWRHIYDERVKSVTVKFGTKWQQANATVIPCYYCGFAVTRGLIEVDHWFEKGSAEDRIQALLKVFRALGDQLTLGAATGNKAAQVDQIMQGHGLTKMGTRNNGPALTDGRLNSLRRNFTDAKRQLSDKGRLVLSTFYVAWGVNDLKAFTKLFVNNFFNLVPACGACNKAKNNR
jgi:hypothetical protein